MNADLKHLIRLQSIDLSILEIQERIDVFPGISKALDEKLSSAQAGLEAAREKSKGDQAARKKLEGEVAVLEGKISKYREQMLSVKTNEEYKAFQKEIEHAQEGIRGVEDRILQLMLDAEGIQAEIKAAETRLKDDQQMVNQERKSSKGSIKRTSARCKATSMNARPWRRRFPQMCCRVMSGSANFAAALESLLPRITCATPARYGCALRYSRKCARMIRLSPVKPASAFSTIRKTSIHRSK